MLVLLILVRRFLSFVLSGCSWFVVGVLLSSSCACVACFHAWACRSRLEEAEFSARQLLEDRGALSPHHNRSRQRNHLSAGSTNARRQFENSSPHRGGHLEYSKEEKDSAALNTTTPFDEYKKHTVLEQARMYVLSPFPPLALTLSISCISCLSVCSCSGTRVSH
jgi:hypothetical protein